MPDLTAAQAQRLAAIEAAPDAPESLRERVAEAIRLALMDEEASYEQVADAALWVITETAR